MRKNEALAEVTGKLQPCDSDWTPGLVLGLWFWGGERHYRWEVSASVRTPGMKWSWGGTTHTSLVSLLLFLLLEKFCYLC